MNKFIFLVLGVLTFNVAGFADEGIVLSKKDSLKLSVGQDKGTGRYVLNISIKQGSRVLTSVQQCQTHEECNSMKSTLLEIHKNLKADERLALQLQDTQTIAKVVKENGVAALSETLLRNFPKDAVVEIDEEGLMTNQEYASNEARCKLNSAEPVLVKNNRILMTTGETKRGQYHDSDTKDSPRVCVIPINHSHVLSIACYTDSSYACDRLTLNSLNITFKNRLNFYFPSNKVASRNIKEDKVDHDAGVKTVEKQSPGRASRAKTAPEKSHKVD